MTNTEIQARGRLISSETATGGNTAARVGGVIEAIGQNLEENVDAIAAEATARASADDTLQDNIDAEASLRQQADTTLETTLQANIDAEASLRQQADAELQDNIDAETTSRQANVATLQAAIEAESTARSERDTTLQTNIDNEEAAREHADSTLSGLITAEASARESADTTLQGNIDAEESAREAADTTLQGNIDAEESARESADSNLSASIAPVWAASTAYAVGAVRMYGNVKYMCTTAHTSGDSFNSSYWSVVTDADEEPAPNSDNNVKSKGVYQTTKLNINCQALTYVDENGTVQTTTADAFMTTPYIPAVEGITISGIQRYTSGGYNVKLCFYDSNRLFISYISGNDNSDETLSSSNIPDDAVYFRANLNVDNGAIYSMHRIDFGGLIQNVEQSVNGVENSIFALRNIVTRKTGLMAVTSVSVSSTPYIDVNDFEDGVRVRCAFSSDNGIQCFDEDYNFLGIYNDYTSVTTLTTITFAFDKSKLQTDTRYIRLFCQDNDGYIDGISFSGKYATTDLGLCVTADASIDYIPYVLCNIKDLKLEGNYFDYEKIIFRRAPAFGELALGTSSSEYFAFQFFQDGAVVSTLRFYIKNGYIDGNRFFYNDGKNYFEYDYSMFKHSTVSIVDGIGLCTQKAMTSAYYRAPGADYILTETASLQNYADGVTFVEYVTDSMQDITIQRYPATVDALAEGSQEYFIFYVWNSDGTMKRKIRCDISDATVQGDVITYVSEVLSFTVDYSIVGDVGRKAGTSRLDMTFAEKCFKLTADGDYHIRTDIKDKKYANVSSSTFSSFAWHKDLVESLGMEYSNFGMGGASHRPYSGAAYNPNYQSTSQPVADRNVLNMVAKICIENIESGYYPDIIASCCVLNDCGSSVTLGKIGTWEEALAATLPSLDISTSAGIVSSFTDFFNSTDSDIVAFRGNSMKMMRLEFELLSQKFPYAQIIICSCQQVTSSSFNQDAITQFNEEQRKLAAYYAIPYIDINGECGINSVTASTFLKSDQLHPNDAGELVYTRFMKERLNQVIAFKH